MDEKPAVSESSNGSDVDSLSTASAYEQHRERLRDANPQGVTSHRSGVNVKEAEEEFSELNRQFSTISHQAHCLSKQISRASKPTGKTEDVERSDSPADSDEPWDLETALRGNRDAETAAGIRSKRIGDFMSDLLFQKLFTCTDSSQESYGITSLSEEWAASRRISKHSRMRLLTFSMFQRR